MSDVFGPWHTEEPCHNEACEIYICHENTECDATTVAVVNDASATHDVNRQRARLIAAAPDLYDCCLMALEVFSEVGGMDEHSESLRKAIAKAEGRS